MPTVNTPPCSLKFRLNKLPMAELVLNARLQALLGSKIEILEEKQSSQNHWKAKILRSLSVPVTVALWPQPRLRLRAGSWAGNSACRASELPAAGLQCFSRQRWRQAGKSWRGHSARGSISVGLFQDFILSNCQTLSSFFPFPPFLWFPSPLGVSDVLIWFISFLERNLSNVDSYLSKILLGSPERGWFFQPGKTHARA